MSQQPRRISRRPNFTAFLLTGGMVGLLAGLLLSLVGPVDSRYSAVAVLGFIALICAGVGVLTGAVVAVLLDRRL